MANVNLRISTSWLDIQGQTGVSNAYAVVSDAATLADLGIVVLAYNLLLNAATTGKAIRSTTHIQNTLAGLHATPAADSRANEVGVLSFPNTVDAALWGFNIPTLLDALIVSPPNLDMTEAGTLDSLVDVLKSPIATGTMAGAFTNNRYQALGDVFATFQSNRHKRTLHSKSYKLAST